jgi:hypothetical protein
VAYIAVLLTQLSDALEHSEIAWPNHKMWLPVPNVPRYMTAISPYGMSKEYDDHGHSPSKIRPDFHVATIAAYPTSPSSSNTATFSGSSLSAYNAWAPHRGFPIPATQWNYTQEPRWEPQDVYIMEAGMDSFVDDAAWRQRGARPSREDVPMPDYVSNSSSSRPVSSMTGFSFEHSRQPSITACMDDEQYNQLIQSLTPTKAAPTVGTRAPSHTPSVIMPPPKPSAAAEARVARYVRSRRTSGFTDGSQPSQPDTRDVSGSSISLLSLNSDKDGKTKSEKKHSKESKKNPKRRTSKEVLKVVQDDNQKEGQKEIRKETEKEIQEEIQVE